MKKFPETPSWVVEYNHETKPRRIPGKWRFEIVTNVPPVKKKKPLK